MYKTIFPAWDLDLDNSRQEPETITATCVPTEKALFEAWEERHIAEMAGRAWERRSHPL